MAEKIPKNILELEENNGNALSSNNITRDELIGNFDRSVELSQQFLSSIFLERGIDLYADKKERNSLGETDANKSKLISDILIFDPGIVIVRPEMYHMTGKICDFLEKNGFSINLLIKKRIKIDEYFDLYHKEITANKHNFRLVLPSRTLAYTNAKSSILVFTRTGKALNKNDNHLADDFSANFKGQDGKVAKKTIRGDIILKEAIRLGFDKLEDNVIAMAVDPFAIYGGLVKKKNGDFYHLRTSPKFYMLMYTAQGIHCPNYKELPHDLASVLSLDQLLELKSILEK